MKLKIPGEAFLKSESRTSVIVIVPIISAKMISKIADSKIAGLKEDTDGEIENSGKSIFEIRIPNFCYIQVTVFDLSCLPVSENLSTR